MTHFILIAIFFSGAGVGRADNARVDHIEFNTKQACEVAAAVVNQHMTKMHRNQTELVCVPTS
jgi:hypothetical protein